MFQETGQDGGVVKDDAVGDQAAAFRPQVLFIFGLEAELAEAGEGYRSSQLVVVFSPVDRFLDVLTQGRGVNIVKQIEAAVDAVVFPERPFRPVVAGMCAQFPNDGALRCLFQCQRDEDALALVPLPDDVVLANLPAGFTIASP